MEISAFFALVVPFIVVVYLAALFLIRAPVAVMLASLLGGLLMGLINLAVDLLAYYTHLWHYTLNGLILHLPLPFYITPVLIYGSVVYLLIWRFWTGRGHWFALLLLIGIPLFGILRDIYGSAITGTAYAIWENMLGAGIVDVLMWVVMFYAGFLVFKRLAPAREMEQDEENRSVSVGESLHS